MSVFAATGPVYGQDSKRSSTGAVSSPKLQDALRRLATNGRNSSALTDAGYAALDLGDTKAAIGFLARAEEINPTKGLVHAGLGRALLAEENPFGALRYFERAISYGIKIRDIAQYRALALDLVGRSVDAQRDYALIFNQQSEDRLIRNYAISLGIAGQVEQAEIILNPLLQKRDSDAWRDRAFIFAMNGRRKEANNIAEATMPKPLADAIKPFFKRMPKLTSAQKAAAVHFGHFPAEENVGVDLASVQLAARREVRQASNADSGLIPIGEPLGQKKVETAQNIKPKKKKRKSKSSSRTGRSSTLSRYGALGDRRAARRKERAAQKARKEAQVAALDPRQVTVLEQKKLPEPPEVVAAKKRQQELLASARPAATPKIIPKAAQIQRNDRSAKITPAVSSSLANSTTPAITAPSATSARTAASAFVPAAKPVSTQKNDALRTAAAPDPQPAATTPKAAPLPALTPKKPALAQKTSAPFVQDNIKFDLASAPKKTSAAAPATPLKPAAPAAEDPPAQLAQASPVAVPENDQKPRTLAEIMRALQVPEAEEKTKVVPVDLDSISPARPKPKSKPKVKPKAAEPKKAEKAKPKPPLHPKRHWVQIATGRDPSALRYDYRRFSKKFPDLFSGKPGWTSKWGKTRRLVVGPFDSVRSAKQFETKFRKGGGDGFAWISAIGTEVVKLPAK